LTRSALSAALTSTPGEPLKAVDSRWSISPDHAALLGVSIAYCLVVALRTAQSMALTFDEVVYASQVARDVPPAMFTAPRARGMPWLLAPVAMVTPSALAIRVSLTLLAGLAMYLAFRPWLTVMRSVGGHHVYVPALAATCFATLWTTALYGTMAYPNLWLAFALVAAAGFFSQLVGQSPPRRGAVVGLTLAFAAASLIRPTDALAAAAPLLIALAVIPRWHRIWPAIATVVGLAVGWGAWIVEAIVRFGGPLERLKDGAGTNESGLVFSLPEHFAAVDGPALLCRPQTLCEQGAALAALWWVLLPLVACVGLFAAYRAGWLSYALVPVAAGTIVALPYLF
jgi:hypothetical protein